MKRLIVVLLLALMAFPAVAQDTEPDPAVQAAKEETAVVYDLGRFFGYVWQMQQDEKDLALDRDQMIELLEVASRIVGTARIEPEWAEQQLDYLELDLLTPAQLMQVDMFAMNREESRVPGSGAGSGGGTGSGPILTYVNGGAFNPIVDESKTIGQDFAEFVDYLEGETAR